MNRLRIVRAALLSSLLLIVLATTALAAPDAPDASKESYKVNRKNATIYWFGWRDPPTNQLDHDQCSAIPEGYTVVNDDGTSLRRKVGSIRTMANGRQVLQIRDVVRGTATDNYGNHYNWVYRQNVWITLNGGIATAKMTDLFRLSGGPAAHELGFKFRWQYETNELHITQELANDELVDFYGEFVWPTEDGVTESTDPAFVPGSLKVDYNYGDWGNCDPI